MKVRISQFLLDKKASIAPLATFLIILVAISGGVAIDMGRWLRAKQITGAAVDTAVLAGARWLATHADDAAGAVAVARNYYQKNVGSRVNLAEDSIDFVVGNGNTSVEATGEAKLKTTLMSLAGIEAMLVLSDVAAGLPKATIATGGSNIEVSVMLDVTGSMCDDGSGPCTTSTKLDGLKEAANKLVDIVVVGDQSEVTTKVALVPFSTRVRIAADGLGSAMMTNLTNLAPTWSGWVNTCIASSGGGGSEGNGNYQCTQYEVQWKQDHKIRPCVTDRYYDNGGQFDLTDDAPGAGKWLNAHGGNRKPFFGDSSDDNPISNPTGTQSNPASHWTYSSSGYCNDAKQANEIVPLTSDADLLKQHIDNLEAYGATAGVLGTAWSWYTLSPKWGASVWTGEAIPASYSDLTETLPSGAPKMRKVAILMTDGVYNTYKGSKNQSQGMLSQKAIQMCAAMKAEGIEIFTVGLALDQLTPSERAHAENTLANCGTDIAHFYNTLTVQQLIQAFEDIGASLRQVSLTR